MPKTFKATLKNGKIELPEQAIFPEETEVIVTINTIDEYHARQEEHASWQDAIYAALDELSGMENLKERGAKIIVHETRESNGSEAILVVRVQPRNNDLFNFFGGEQIHYYLRIDKTGDILGLSQHKSTYFKWKEKIDSKR
jgi:hypothetical protein